MRIYLILSLIGLVFLAGCTQLNISSMSSGRCHELAEEMIPDKINLLIGTQQNVPGDWSLPTGAFGSYESFWNDWSEITAPYMMSIYFRPGNQEGENVNYYYFEKGKFIYEDNSLKYSKQIINDDGVILGIREFGIAPTLKEIPGSENHISDIHKIKSFEIIKPNFIFCYWVTDEGESIK
ncbi:MAG: hypothetical protein HYS80_02455 [Candidatus Aenigmarchaeota archaeon]|nr:hypothetical protein [Candidatus Aenigmarchaeota archaeon]